MKIRPAQNDDLGAIKALLAGNDLPSSDVTAELLKDFVVAEDTNGILVGNIGLERFGRDALLRSLVVTEAARDSGLGGNLVAQAEDFARNSEVGELWLLTTTAAEFFRRAGYVTVDRAAAPDKVQASMQFAALCPASAVCMKKRL
ncbi:arsenic resistance N-acetyltransferase ArsN2 [Paraburkholderia bryophila]|uniref:Amino-acid N-acetyltransferase n=1 Tax=Paraburkholderia bryophila TaxID=420952 RepID=A0A7Y9WIZ5_9BURK|nr:arsenic resistance N-acetyltransferase ArsN2 [Paraburkholderia bryophila]NYH21744.1 amino-acid N-acetyltransferase [Paraburkholderia bryophila]